MQEHIVTAGVTVIVGKVMYDIVWDWLKNGRNGNGKKPDYKEDLERLRSVETYAVSNKEDVKEVKGIAIEVKDNGINQTAILKQIYGQLKDNGVAMTNAITIMGRKR